MFVEGHVLAPREVPAVAGHSGSKVPSGLTDVATWGARARG